MKKHITDYFKNTGRLLALSARVMFRHPFLWNYLDIPGSTLSFGVLKRFQAQGDFEVLSERSRRLLRVHLGPDASGLLELRRILESANS